MVDRNIEGFPTIRRGDALQTPSYIQRDEMECGSLQSTRWLPTELEGYLSTNIFPISCLFVRSTNKRCFQITSQDVGFKSQIRQLLDKDLAAWTTIFHRVLADLPIETCLPEEWKGLHLETCSKDPFIKSSKVQLSTDGLEV